MFAKCSKLKYLDLSGFNTEKVNSMEKIFYDCSSLIYLNLNSFKLKSTTIIDGFFPDLSYKIKTCITDNTLLSEDKIINDCSDVCFRENIKINLINKTCVYSCNNIGYEYNNMCYEKCPKNIGYEYNNMCYEKCPKGTILNYIDNTCKDNICNELNQNSTECLDKTPQGYYLDSYDQIYKTCFENCKFCNGPGNRTNNNCIICKSDFIFLNESLEENNCYEKCEYYYYFDESNNYHCVDACPKNFNKLIKVKNKCIDDCKKDDIYIYEFKNICYDKNIIVILSEETESNEITYDKKNENNGKEYLDEELKNIQDLFQYGFNTTDINNGNDYINSNEEITFTITTTENQKIINTRM